MLSADTNAHSSVWGDRHDDRRGSDVEALMATHNLDLLNDGITPTYQSAVGSSFIDITGISSTHSKLFTDWSCGSAPSYSDHNLILFSLHPYRLPTTTLHPRTNCNWADFAAPLRWATVPQQHQPAPSLSK